MSTYKKTIPEFTFRELTEEAYQQAGLDPLPFPIRKSHEASGFHTMPINLAFLLQELESYTKAYPEQLDLYQNNIESLSMTNATNQMNMGDAKGALASLGYGLRANPRNHSLRLHQAIALQICEKHDLAAIEFEAVLGVMPYAIDPTIRALAAKAYAAAGQYEEAFMIIDALAETAFNDPELAALRLSLAKGAGMTAPLIGDLTQYCEGCGSELDLNKRFCTTCGKKMQTD